MLTAGAEAGKLRQAVLEVLNLKAVDDRPNRVGVVRRGESH